MLIYKAEEVAWTPLFIEGGIKVGLILAPALALWCREATHQDRDFIVTRVWEMVRPRRNMIEPSAWIDFYKDSLLPVGIYKRHGGSDGKWLTAESFDIERLDRDDVLTYTYHHTEERDQEESRWLEFAFGKYMDAMLVYKANV